MKTTLSSPGMRFHIRTRPRLLWRVGAWLFALAALMGIVFGSGTPIAHASVTRVLLGQKGPGNTSTLHLPSTLQPNAPVIQHHPKVYLDFLGSEWDQPQYASTIATIQGVFKDLAGSEYNNILTQYTDGSGNPDGYVHNDVRLVDTWINDTVSSLPSYIDITDEVGDAEKLAVSHFNLPSGNHSVMNDVQIIVFPQPGTSYLDGGDFCGMHYFDTTTQAAYSVIQYPSATFCHKVSGNTIGEDMAWTAVHEYVEAATDTYVYARFIGNIFPFTGNGWQTNEVTQMTPDEIADICEGWGDSDTYQDPKTGALYTLPYIWSKADNACTNSVGQDYPTPDTAIPFHGVHTVQGAILGEYKALGADGSVIGAPLTEETPIGVGRVSYFNGTCGGVDMCAGIYWSSGSGAHFVRGAEFNEYYSLGGAASVIGFPVTNDAAIAGGSVTYFNGTCGGTTKCAGIYWSGGSGAHYVRGAEYDEYVAVGQANSVIGFPVTDDVSMNGGSVTYFNGTCGGSNKCAGIYWSGGSGAHYVRGAEYDEYVKVGQANSVLGFPVTDDVSMNGGSVTYFNGTCGGTNKCAGIYWSGGSGAHYVRGAEYQKYVAMGEANGPLAFPVSDDTSIAGGSVTYFSANAACGTPGPSNSDGGIYWSSLDGAHEVQGCIFAKYLATAGPNGVLGFPVSDEYTNARGNRESDFDNGYIEMVNGQAVVHNGCKVSATVTTC